MEARVSIALSSPNELVVFVSPAGGGGGGGALVPTMPGFACPNVKDMGPFSAPRE